MCSLSSYKQRERRECGYSRRFYRLNVYTTNLYPPTGNLDEETAAQIRELFRSMAHEMGKCVIVVTHSQEFAKGADTIIRLKNRKLITDRSGE